MKTNYTGLWLLLTTAFTMIVGMAFSSDISLGNWTVKKAPISEALFAGNVNSSDIVAPDTVSQQLLEEGPAEMDSVPKNIFLFGDSMTLNLALRLGQYAKYNGHELHSINWDSSNTKLWAETDTLKKYLNKYKPDYIFISLGSNEVYFKDPNRRLPYVKKILSMIGDIPYVWIGPPNWNEDTGINDMLEATCRKGAFFRSQGIPFKRKKDNIHPTRESSADWMDSIMRWLPSSSHPILSATPPDSIGKVTKNIMIIKALNK